MWDGRLRLITGGMEEEGCYYQHCCRCGGAGGEAGSHRQTTMIQRLQRDNTKLRRMAQCIALALFFLIALFLAFLGALVLQVRGHQSPPASQPMIQPNSSSSQQQQDEALGSPSAMLRPSAMLTVLYPRKVNGSRLEWDSESGHAFCRGGFKYSNGNLTVPRSGIYRVYLQITYHDETCHDNLHIKLTNEVLVWHDTYHKDVPLLSAVDTVSCVESWTKSLYTSGSFELEANSLLHVVSSDIRLIAKNEHQVFFGAELLS